jgi:signal transduction histidine kinase
MPSEADEAERRERALLDAIPDYVFRIRRDGTYLDFHAQELNDALADRDRFIGSNVRDHLPARVADDLLVVIGRVLASGEAASFAGEVEQAGVAHPFESRIVKSGPDEVVTIVRDVTETRAVESALRESRARIVDASDAERRRLERNLHDGAQQRLVALSLSLRLAGTTVGPDPREARELFEAASAELSEALAELRELARGIHPAILTARGLASALEGLAARAPVPVAIECTPERLPPPVEVAAYYVVSEALTNIAKYAQASAASVSVSVRGGSAVIAITDDGVGGADASDGSGLSGLADRIGAVGGRLVIDSPADVGTTIRAEIPLSA